MIRGIASSLVFDDKVESLLSVPWNSVSSEPEGIGSERFYKKIFQLPTNEMLTNFVKNEAPRIYTQQQIESAMKDELIDSIVRYSVFNDMAQGDSYWSPGDLFELLVGEKRPAFQYKFNVNANGPSGGNWLEANVYSEIKPRTLTGRSITMFDIACEANNTSRLQHSTPDEVTVLDLVNALYIENRQADHAYLGWRDNGVSMITVTPDSMSHFYRELSKVAVPGEAWLWLCIAAWNTKGQLDVQHNVGTIIERLIPEGVESVLGCLRAGVYDIPALTSYLNAEQSPEVILPYLLNGVSLRWDIDKAIANGIDPVMMGELVKNR